MEHLPIYLNLQGRDCLVIGGGEVAARKVALLQEAKADNIRVVSPDLGRSLQEAADDKTISYREGLFEDNDIGEAHIVFACTDDLEVNQRISQLCQARNIPVNVVNDPSLCSFITPSIIDRSPVLVAVSTGGASPVLARLIRARLETLIPANYGQLAELAGRFRDRVKAAFKVPSHRRIFWEKVLQGPVAEMIFAGQSKAAEERLEETLDEQTQAAPHEHHYGEVYLIGGGPGDPDLLTFRALRLMQQADVVVYDRLVAKAILDLTRRDAERVYVGKERDNHAVPQEDINVLLARLAKEGKRVCRLKGGDPFIFGRGGEEIETLVEEGVPFQVVPGITAASGAASYSGIPITHRDFSQAAIFVTGHLRDGSINLNWPMLAQPNQTVVFYMGLVGLPVICEQLIKHGVSPDMPIALVQQATTQKQRVITGTLATMPQIAEETKPKPPTLIIVGNVVQLHDKLNWFRPSGINSLGDSKQAM